MIDHPYTVLIIGTNWWSHMAKIQWCKDRGINRNDYNVKNIGINKKETWCFKEEADAVAFKLRYGNQ